MTPFVSPSSALPPGGIPGPQERQHHRSRAFGLVDHRPMAGAVDFLDVGVEKLRVGKARQGLIDLSPAISNTHPRPATLDLGFVEALQTGAASYGAAAGTLFAITARDLSGEMSVEGSASLRAGGRVILQGAGAAFNGEYYVTQTSHRLGQGSRDGWHTLLGLVRADRARFVLPEVGDEVLVAFEHGDLARPVVVGSLWNGEPPPVSSPCRPGRD